MSLRLRLRKIAALLLATVPAGTVCARADEVTVFAAASLADALGEVGRSFEAASGHHVAFNFGGSNDLARQIEAGAPADLARLPRLALADPEAVPAGVYARRYLESAGLWPALRERVVPTLDVRAALAAVASENVPAGIVYRTDAALSKRVRVAFEVPRASGPRIVYVLAPIGAALRPPARALLAELVSARAARVYEKYGFAVLASP